MSDSDSDNNLPSDLEEAWQEGCSAIIPEKSRVRYEQTYKIFKEWREAKKIALSEKGLLAYFVMRSGQLKAPGSLWAEYSMLKCTIFLYDAIDISKFATLIAYLKRKNVGYRPKKAKVYTKEDMEKFLNEAPDEQFLIQKVAMILGVSGACRREELYKMTMSDIEEREGMFIINIPNTKTNIKRTFTVVDKENEAVHYLEILRKYIKLRPSNAKSNHLFLNYRNGKCTNQVVGKGTIGGWPSKIAKYLKLQAPEAFTGHSFRRTSATLLANKGVDVLGLKRHGGWRSSAVAESYVEDSLHNKIEFAQKILHNDVGGSLQQPGISTSESLAINHNTKSSNTSGITVNYNNCTFNFNQ